MDKSEELAMARNQIIDCLIKVDASSGASVAVLLDIVMSIFIEGGASYNYCEVAMLESIALYKHKFREEKKE